MINEDFSSAKGKLGVNTGCLSDVCVFIPGIVVCVCGGSEDFLGALLCQDSGLTLSNVMPALQTQNT